ncbi:inorganic polyphosphate kinase [Corynebacterium phocae]|uniref:NAD kinase n=1 Tax=Corynebacterium phocae TaxID=161895 RepID=A0A1L7D329_9CORY|nr:NAD kinase [Corynebacterium phocae]APT92576.1 inorganic polyphosphate kinase [Corynebacterium phocae]KAA8725176.1 NAD kinase [Corynebacterium phocae]
MGRRILLVPHTGRADNVEAMFEAADRLRAAGIEVAVCADERAEVDFGDLEVVAHDEAAAAGCEMVLVLGGDGTFLRAADLAFAVDVPVLGINLGHVGFLAESEAESMDDAIERVISCSYRVVGRMTLSVRVLDQDGQLIGTSWALNEASVENLNRSGVLDAVLEIDGRPVSSYGCDGMLISSPTGSTAYAFSAGGPVLWPELDAIVVVPNNAHALFAKPLVVSPKSCVAVESVSSTSPAIVIMDGTRDITMPPGSRVEVVRGEREVKWVRLDSLPFADRLVSKFRLPVEGWRGPRG